MSARLRRAVAAVAWMLLGAVAAVFSLYVAIARGLPELQPWHHYGLEEDFGEDDAGDTLADYLEREAELFEQLEDAVRERGGEIAAAAYGRFDPRSPANPANQPRNWNRTTEFDVARPRGGALLVHGLSDSPYSMRALAELLRDRGWYSLALRLPGHGTYPGALLDVTWRDWRAAFRLAARHVAARVGPDRPLVLFGYSTGAALAVEYALGVAEGRDDPPARQLVLISPAIAVSPVAALAGFQRRLSSLPFLEKLAWTEVLPEYDPFKYNSFPVKAGQQIYELTRENGKRLGALAARAADTFPATLAFVAAVDATVTAAAVADTLLASVGENGSELVLFDTNRISEAEPLMKPGTESLLERLEATPTTYTLSVVTNAGPETAAVVVRTRASGQREWSTTELGLAWPRGVHSLSHVALPFPEDDPIYGAGRDHDARTLHLGSLELRGERGVLAIPMEQAMRLRYNPFFAYLEARVAEVLEGAEAERR